LIEIKTEFRGGFANSHPYSRVDIKLAPRNSRHRGHAHSSQFGYVLKGRLFTHAELISSPSYFFSTVQI